MSDNNVTLEAFFEKIQALYYQGKLQELLNSIKEKLNVEYDISIFEENTKTYEKLSQEEKDNLGKLLLDTTNYERLQYDPKFIEALHKLDNTNEMFN